MLIFGEKLITIFQFHFGGRHYTEGAVLVPELVCQNLPYASKGAVGYDK